jgi:cytochrome P450
MKVVMSSRLNLMAPEVRADPYPHYARLRRDAPVCQVDPGGLWAVTRYEDAITVLKDPQRFSSEGMRRVTSPAWLESPPFAHAMIVRDPPDHGRLRALVNRAFGTATLAWLEPWVRELSNSLAAQLPGGQAVDFVEVFSRPLPTAVIGRLLGVDDELRPRLKQWADDMTSVSAVAPGDTARIAQIRASVQEARGYIAEVIARRREAPSDDLVSELIAARMGEEALSYEELMSFLLMLLVAGMETTMHLINHTLLLLLAHPEVLARARADLSLIPRLVEESLRFEPPVHGIMRTTTAETELGGVRLPAGAFMVVLLGSANRDEERFPGADRFDIDRPGPHNLPFGHGIHFCLGAMLARLEARLALEALLPRLRAIESRGPVVWNQSLSVRGPRVMPVELVLA